MHGSCMLLRARPPPPGPLQVTSFTYNSTCSAIGHRRARSSSSRRLRFSPECSHDGREGSGSGGTAPGGSPSSSSSVPSSPPSSSPSPSLNNAIGVALSSHSSSRNNSDKKKKSSLIVNDSEASSAGMMMPFTLSSLKESKILRTNNNQNNTTLAVVLLPTEENNIPFAVAVETCTDATTKNEAPLFTPPLQHAAQVLHALHGDVTVLITDEHNNTTKTHLTAGASFIVPPKCRRALTSTTPFDVLCTLLPTSFLKGKNDLTTTQSSHQSAAAAARETVQVLGWDVEPTTTPQHSLKDADVQRMLNAERNRARKKQRQKASPNTRRIDDVAAFRVPRQTNRLAFLHDPVTNRGIKFTYALEVFEKGHKTPRHTHLDAHELFMVLAGDGGRGVYKGNAQGRRFETVDLSPGDVVVFPPGLVHAIDNKDDAQGRLYTLQLMAPNDAFAERVQSGEALKSLEDEDICALLAERCE